MERNTIVTNKQVLGFAMPKTALSVVVGGAGVVAGANGKKIIPAGTPLGGAEDTLANEQAVLVVDNTATAQGILEHDIDVTSGKGNGTLVIWGFVNENRLGDVTVSTAAKTALKGKVTFFKRNA